MTGRAGESGFPFGLDRIPVLPDTPEPAPAGRRGADLGADTATIFVAVIGAGLGLAGLILREMKRLDGRIDDTASDRRAFRAEMRTFEREMLRIAERQSLVERHLDELGAPAG